eukprot:TRINITY_DN7345_c0_g1_i1.p1 TRINITY_DN7345_c0_g1~~TRINITY_DN7345_c0_g1_i1.p1  ORF type:complete len:59 (-),score=9.97 TRINITY_DN7345_c0_g1_i1:317-493(-)
MAFLFLLWMRVFILIFVQKFSQKHKVRKYTFKALEIFTDASLTPVCGKICVFEDFLSL